MTTTEGKDAKASNAAVDLGKVADRAKVTVKDKVTVKGKETGNAAGAEAVVSWDKATILQRIKKATVEAARLNLNAQAMLQTAAAKTPATAIP